ncbi:MAG: hypothetical protein R3341_06735 [Methylophaga sp.]|nr:hypothetical protein [Methylophaga sp.]
MSSIYQHLNITEIAIQSDLSNMAHFSHNFRYAYGGLFPGLPYSK